MYEGVNYFKQVADQLVIKILLKDIHIFFYTFHSGKSVK